MLYRGFRRLQPRPPRHDIGFLTVNKTARHLSQPLLVDREERKNKSTQISLLIIAEVTTFVTSPGQPGTPRVVIQFQIEPGVLRGFRRLAKTRAPGRQGISAA